MDIMINIIMFLQDLKDNELKQPKDCCPNECTYHLKWSTIPNTSQIYFEMNFKALTKESWAAVGFAENRQMVRFSRYQDYLWMIETLFWFCSQNVDDSFFFLR